MVEPSGYSQAAYELTRHLGELIEHDPETKLRCFER